MSEKTKPKSAKRPPKALAPATVAAMLAYAGIYDDAAAAKKYATSKRSIGRWRSRVRNGECPEVAELVARAETLVIEKEADALALSLDEGLKELRSRYPKMTNEELTKAVEMVGELKQGQDFLSTDVPSLRPRAAASDPEAPARNPPGGTPRAAGAGAGTASTAGAGTPTPVH